MKKIIILILAVGFSTFSFSQTGILKGKIIDKQSKKALPGVSVQLYQQLTLKAKTISGNNGTYIFKNLSDGSYKVEVSFREYKTASKSNISVVNGKSTILNFQVEKILLPISNEKQEMEESYMDFEMATAMPIRKTVGINAMGMAYQAYDKPYIQHNTESYDMINENTFKEVLNNPLSTFSVDVDRASYSNIRRFLKQSLLPNKDAVRIEEMVNYFDYDYPQPAGEVPFSINMELNKCPWNTKHELLAIGLQGKEIKTENIPAANLVFLLDVSGSMNSPNKLPLLKQAFKILIDKLRPEDKVAIVVYAGAAGVVLESTRGDKKDKIITALSQLQAGGSTAGGEGIILAYTIAKQNFVKNGNNRVILATDGDFNVGASSNAEMVRLIEEKRNDGIFLSVLGFGMGNYKDSKMELISNAGNGNYAYIDNILEAKKVFGKEIWGTLYTIAKDVKFQIEFNPAQVKAYRLIGYENRILNKEDFNDDKKDAGEIGSGHTVTALYEIIPADSREQIPDVDPLEYQKTSLVDSKNLLTVKLRYKNPEEDESKLITRKIKRQDIFSSEPSNNFNFAAAVAEFGMLLRNSEFKADSDFNHVILMANKAKGDDENGYRNEFIKLVETAQLLNK
ncbi:MAG: DUF3520 domain-containing protein [Chlorobi bacterium]|nr:DUF3520 domain-containing protein [Chlorobiota bacterium]